MKLASDKKFIEPGKLVDRTFVVISAGANHLHLREYGSATSVDVEVTWPYSELSDIFRFVGDVDDLNKTA